MTPRIRPRPAGVRYRVIVTEETDDAEVVFDHTGDAFVAGVATLTGTRIDAPVDHDGDQHLRERLVVYITNAVHQP